MKVIFFGTPEFVLPPLVALYKVYGKDLIAVVTQSPKKTGREKKIIRSAVDNWAYKHKIPVIYDFDKIPQADLCVVAAYGKIIPNELISKFPNGILNIHPSLLPKYRGASPIQYQIIDGVTQTGVTVIKMDEKMDHGPVISKFTEKIEDTDTNETLRKRLFERSAKFLVDLIPNYLSNKIKLKPQDEDQATYTKIITKENGFVENPFEDPGKTERIYRAFQPWPGIYASVELIMNNVKLHKRLKLNKLHLEDNQLVLDEVQLEGKTPVSWEQFKSGYPQFKFE